MQDYTSLVSLLANFYYVSYIYLVVHQHWINPGIFLSNTFVIPFLDAYLFAFLLVLSYSRVSFRGRGEHSPLLGFGLPPLGNFDLKVNQFKCFDSCTMHNKC